MNSAPKFTLREKAKSSWLLVPISYRLALKNYEQILILFFLPTLIFILATLYFGNTLSVVQKNFTTRQLIGFGLALVWLILSLFNYPASTYFRLRAAQNQTPPSIGDCYREGLKVFWKVLVTEIVFWILVLVGLALLIVPGVIIFRRYCFANFYSVDHPELSLRKIFHQSAETTASFVYHIYGTFGVMILFELVASILFGTSVFGYLLLYLTGYSVLFLPALRYLEINRIPTTAIVSAKSSQSIDKHRL